MRLTDAQLAKGQKLAAAKRRRIGEGTDLLVAAALARGVPADPHALCAELPGMTYARARYSLMRLGLWEARTR